MVACFTGGRLHKLHKPSNKPIDTQRSIIDFVPLSPSIEAYGEGRFACHHGAVSAPLERIEKLTVGVGLDQPHHGSISSWCEYAAVGVYSYSSAGAGRRVDIDQGICAA